ncbi:hypothetical protein POSPLADRAFT_1035502 [Postia placenta MAD-698-R-SB12]|uniref:Uncharacterized protein n=1 Tax=Postia placenta MAD-698-R-SB12 TaxID=670580 RepID=A0A1X6MV18_9APHY|nr:hypothetical protein POSPLADRAFT_1035502 [Postia placenta MAD-698-R-SB12]OSX60043.1 hypothetical protein POSPLADRAFT_1035502 [Postia placenta MAD-698-R-SB12]
MPKSLVKARKMQAAGVTKTDCTDVRRRTSKASGDLLPVVGSVTALRVLPSIDSAVPRLKRVTYAIWQMADSRGTRAAQFAAMRMPLAAKKWREEEGWEDSEHEGEGESEGGPAASSNTDNQHELDRNVYASVSQPVRSHIAHPMSIAQIPSFSPMPNTPHSRPRPHPSQRASAHPRTMPHPIPSRRIQIPPSIVAVILSIYRDSGTTSDARRITVSNVRADVQVARGSHAQLAAPAAPAQS